MPMRQLPPSTVAYITSSQIITCVSSAVKELTENALDAGAMNIDVKLEDFGLFKIEVRDDGRGISKEDTAYMGLSSYTSKISDMSDLEHLESYGFRGEALNALCQMAEVSITTKTDKDPVAMTYTLNSKGEITSEKPSHVGKGTVVTVYQLFAKMPVRRKLCRVTGNARADLRKSGNILKVLSVIHPQVRITFCHNKCLVWQKASVSTLRQSMLQAVGHHIVNDLEELTIEEDDLKLFLLIPRKGLKKIMEISQPNVECMMIYINKRPVRNRKIEQLLLKCVGKHLDIHIPSYKYLTCLIAIDMSPKELDVNLEPDKTKVLLRNEEKFMTRFEEILTKYYEISFAEENKPVEQNKEAVIPAVEENHVDDIVSQAKRFKLESMSNPPPHNKTKEDINNGFGNVMKYMPSISTENENSTEKNIQNGLQEKTWKITSLFGESMSNMSRINLKETSMFNKKRTIKEPLFKISGSYGSVDQNQILPEISRCQSEIPRCQSEISRCQSEIPRCQSEIARCQSENSNEPEPVKCVNLTDIPNSDQESAQSALINIIKSSKDVLNISIESSTINLNFNVSELNKSNNSVECKTDRLLIDNSPLKSTVPDKTAVYDNKNSHFTSAKEVLLQDFIGSTPQEYSVESVMKNRPCFMLDDPNDSILSSSNTLGTQVGERIIMNSPNELQQQKCAFEIPQISSSATHGTTSPVADVMSAERTCINAPEKITPPVKFPDTNIETLWDAADQAAENWSKGLLKTDAGQPVQGSCVLIPGATKPASKLTAPAELDLSVQSASSQLGCEEQSAFTKFSRDMRPKILQENPGLLFTNVAGMLVERWRNLPPEEKARYETIAQQEIHDRREERRKLKHTVKMCRQMKAARMRVLSGKPVKCKKRNISEVYEKRNIKYAAVTLEGIRETLNRRRGMWIPRDEDKLTLVGQSRPSGNWIYCRGHEVGIIRHWSLNEVVYYHKLMADHSVPIKNLEKSIRITESDLGDELWEFLLSLKRKIDPITKIETVTTPGIAMNGFQLEITKGIDYYDCYMTGTAAISRYHGKEELKETLQLIKANGDENGPYRCRPRKIVGYIQSEAVRESRLAEYMIPREELCEKLKFWFQNLKDTHSKCWHDTPVFAPLYKGKDESQLSQE